ncbi:MAG: hypothetical protein JO258_06725, partial [Alphaproteobacteria bacterium]|nr:hypothetical protein [Alphaproteobacteria bacterium]
LMTLELRLAAEQRLRLDLPLLSLSDYASIAALAARLAQLVAKPAPDAAAAELAARHEPPLDPFALGGVDLAAEE